MSNLKALAFPFVESGDTNNSLNKGLTKHEYAAILMAQGLLSKIDGLPSASERADIGYLAYELAENVLGYFK